MNTVLKTFTLFILSTAFAFAGTQTILETNIEGEARQLNLELTTDSRSDITGMKLVEINNGRVTDSRSFNSSQVFDGIVLHEARGRQVLTLISDNFAKHQGGNISVRYLFNGITGTVRTMELDLQRDGDRWVVVDAGKVVKGMFIYKNKKRLVGEIGIRSIRLIYR